MALPPWTKPCSRSAERRGGRSCGSPVPRRSGPRTRDSFVLPVMLLNGARYDRRTHKAIGYLSLDQAAVGVTTTLVSVNNGNEPGSGRLYVVGASGGRGPTT